MIAQIKEKLSRFFDAQLRFVLGPRRIVVGKNGNVGISPTIQDVVAPDTLPLKFVFGDDVRLYNGEVWLRTYDVVSGLLGTFSRDLVGEFFRINDEVFFIGRFPLTPLSRCFFLCAINFMVFWSLMSVILVIDGIASNIEPLSEFLIRTVLILSFGITFMFIGARFLVWFSDEIVGYRRKRLIVQRVSELLQHTS